MNDRISATVRQLASTLGAVPPYATDLPGAIATLVKSAAYHESDPYIILGVLVESIAHTLACSIPAQKQVEAAKNVTSLLLNRFTAQGLIR
jgi:hypothetical protein